MNARNMSEGSTMYMLYSYAMALGNGPQLSVPDMETQSAYIVQANQIGDRRSQLHITAA